MILTVQDNIIRIKWILKIMKLSRVINYNKVRNTVKEKDWVIYLLFSWVSYLSESS